MLDFPETPFKVILTPRLSSKHPISTTQKWNLKKHLVVTRVWSFLCKLQYMAVSQKRFSHSAWFLLNYLIIMTILAIVGLSYFCNVPPSHAVRFSRILKQILVRAVFPFESKGSFRTMAANVIFRPPSSSALLCEIKRLRYPLWKMSLSTGDTQSQLWVCRFFRRSFF